MRNKKVFVAIAVIFLTSSAAVVTTKIWSDKAAQAEQEKQSSTSSASTKDSGSSEHASTDTPSSGASLAANQLTIEPIPKGTRKNTKGDRVTACTPAYEDMMEIENNPGLLDTMSDKITESCTSELSKNIRTWDKTIQSLTESCMEEQETYTEEEKNECRRLANIIRTAFAENEFKGMDPKDLPSPVLRAMIAFRLIQNEEYTKAEADIDYFLKLVSEEQRLSPDRNMIGLQAKLLGDLVELNPEKHEDEFQSNIDDIERKSPEAGLTVRMARYKRKIVDPDFQAELDEFIQRHPQEPYGYYIKASLHANKGDWAGADSVMAKVLAMPLSDKDKQFYQRERAKFASKESTYTMRYSFSFTM